MPEKLVSSTITSEEESSTKLLLTTALSTKVNSPNLNHHITSTTTTTTTSTSTTTRVPFHFKTTQNYTKTNLANSNWRMRHYSDLQYSPSSPYSSSSDFYSSPMPTSMIMMRDKWRNKSGCYYSCIQNSKGLQTVVSRYDYTTSIRLCEPSNVVSRIILILNAFT